VSVGVTFIESLGLIRSDLNVRKVTNVLVQKMLWVKSVTHMHTHKHTHTHTHAHACTHIYKKQRCCCGAEQLLTSCTAMVTHSRKHPVTRTHTHTYTCTQTRFTVTL